MITALLPIFFAMLLLGLPIFAALAFSVFTAIEFFKSTSPVIVPMRMFTGMRLSPNSVNTIPQQARFSIDLRHPPRRLPALVPAGQPAGRGRIDLRDS